METPLDVLSRAATLIHDQLKSANNDDSNQVRRELIGYEDDGDDGDEEELERWNSMASKELPTRTKKERRRNERHYDLISTASRNSRTHRKEAEAAAAAAAAAAVDETVDHPLDMSTSSRRGMGTSAHNSGRSPPPYPQSRMGSDGLPAYPGAAGGYPMYPSPPDYMGRPSVITCASSLRSSPAPSCPSPCSSTGSVSSSSVAAMANIRPGSPVHHHHHHQQQQQQQLQQQQRGRHDIPDRIPQRREIISSGMSDPVIDEHFRRSLGERYTHLFASTSPAPSSSLTAADSSSNPSRDDKLPSTVNVTGLSVDDHFAKALGETWLKLQNESKDKEINGSISDSQPGSPMTTQRPGLVLT